MNAQNTTPSTYDWLCELGAVRPMTPVMHQVLVLGELHEGFYPIEWQMFRDTITRDFNGKQFSREPVEQWRLFGIQTTWPLTKEDCQRILRSI